MKVKESESERRQRECLYRGNHTRCPSGYLAWHQWAERMSETHDQKQCPGCDLWVIWTPKEMPVGEYGGEAEQIEPIDLEWDEVMHFMYLPVKFPLIASMGDVRLPERLAFLQPLIDTVMEIEDTENRYIYVTARRGYATPDNPLNRPGWHCDGFGTNDMNFVWYDRWPTRIAVQPFPDISSDHTVSMEQFADQVSLRNVVELPEKWLLRFNPFVVHTTPLIPAPGGFRSFVKISVSDHRYNLKGNSHNHRFDYDWEMYDRSDVRNDPSYGQGDFYIPPEEA